MRAKIRDTEIFFDVEGASLVPDGPRLVERPTAFLLHGGPGGDHSGFKPAFSPLAERMQLVYVDHRGQGRSARGPKETYTLDNNVDDLEAVLEGISACGWRAAGKPQILQSGPNAGKRVVYVRDPDGTTIEFMEMPLRGS